MVGLSSLLTLLPVGSALAQFVATPKDLKTATGYAGVKVRYKQVPTGICELDPKVKSFTGYADVAENQHIFWWFFETRNGDPTKAPLTVWINGGPGSSSMIGLFQENGPCGIDENGDVVNNPYSWSNVSNMLFIDQPTQTGFSYSQAVPGYIDPTSGLIVTLPSNECPDYAQDFSCGTYPLPDETLTANSTMAAAPNFWKTLQGFMGAFPQYSREGFHFTSESYGGHYGPVFNEYIEQQNANLPYGAKKIKLETVSIGNGWYDPLIQYQAYYNFTVSPGNSYDYKPFNASIESRFYSSMYGKGNCVEKLKDCYARGWNEICADADNFCFYETEYLLDYYADRDEYDIRELSPDPFPYEYYVDYLNTPKVQKAIGAFINFTESSNTVYNAFTSTGDDSRMDGTIGDVQKLLKQGIRVTQYYGDADYICNWVGGLVVADEVDAPGYSSAGFVNISFSDHGFHGQVREAGSFSFVRIFLAGHEVPFYQPLASLEMFERIINGLDIATGKHKITPGYKTIGPKTSTYKEGISTVQMDVTPAGSTYNTTTGAPNPPPPSTKSKKGKARKRLPVKPGYGRKEHRGFNFHNGPGV